MLNFGVWIDSRLVPCRLGFWVRSKLLLSRMESCIKIHGGLSWLRGACCVSFIASSLWICEERC